MESSKAYQHKTKRTDNTHQPTDHFTVILCSPLLMASSVLDHGSPPKAAEGVGNQGQTKLFPAPLPPQDTSSRFLFLRGRIPGYGGRENKFQNYQMQQLEPKLARCEHQRCHYGYLQILIPFRPPPTTLYQNILRNSSGAVYVTITYDFLDNYSSLKLTTFDFTPP